MIEIWRDCLLWASSTREAGSLLSLHRPLASISDHLSLSPSCATASASTCSPARVTALHAASRVTSWETTHSPVWGAEIESPGTICLGTSSTRLRPVPPWPRWRRSNIYCQVPKPGLATCSFEGGVTGKTRPWMWLWQVLSPALTLPPPPLAQVEPWIRPTTEKCRILLMPAGSKVSSFCPSPSRHLAACTTWPSASLSVSEQHWRGTLALTREKLLASWCKDFLYILWEAMLGWSPAAAQKQISCRQNWMV